MDDKASAVRTRELSHVHVARAGACGTCPAVLPFRPGGRVLCSYGCAQMIIADPDALVRRGRHRQACVCLECWPSHASFACIFNFSTLGRRRTPATGRMDGARARGQQVLSDKRERGRGGEVFRANCDAEDDRKPASAFYWAQRPLRRHGIALANDVSDRARCPYALASLELIRPSSSPPNFERDALNEQCGRAWQGCKTVLRACSEPRRGSAGFWRRRFRHRAHFGLVVFWKAVSLGRPFDAHRAPTPVALAAQANGLPKNHVQSQDRPPGERVGTEAVAAASGMSAGFRRPTECPLNDRRRCPLS
jgi:hypothetical protein